ncbi:MAG: mobile mystery protein A [Betaproteobacteria bacterium]|nr:mobile mystery protein A [Betaproteobacteria bacterium]
MTVTYRLLKLEQTDQLLRPWRRLTDTAKPRGGWIRAVREALGMTTVQLAKRLGVTQQAVTAFEKNEATGKITLESLEKLASAMDCRIVYAVVPNASPLAEMRRARARALAERQVKRVSHSMKLEDQGVGAREEKRQLEQLTDELLRGSPRKLWD